MSLFVTLWAALVSFSMVVSNPPILKIPGQPEYKFYTIPSNSAELICNCTITQGSNSYGISALQGTVSAVNFYSYGVPNTSSANTGLEISNGLIIFLYEDINTGIISLFIIADIANDGTGGSLQFDVNCLPSTAFVSVQDDGGEFSGVPPLISGNWSWGDCCTDGGVILSCNHEKQKTNYIGKVPYKLLERTPTTTNFTNLVVGENSNNNK